MALPIIPWIGGKRRLADRIIPQFPPHTCYVEVFAGGGRAVERRELIIYSWDRTAEPAGLF